MRLSPTLSGYIARQYMVWFATFFLVLALIVLIGDTLELLRRAATHPDASFAVVLHMALLKLPQTVQDLLPFAVLFGGIMAFWRLTRSHELVVARAVGVSVWQFMAPALAIAAVAGIAKMMLLNPFAALTVARYQMLEAKYLKNQVSQLAIAPSGLWLRQNLATPDGKPGHMILHAAKVTPDLHAIEDVLVLLYGDQNQFIGRVDAPSGRLADGAWQLADARYARSGTAAKPVGAIAVPTDFTPAKIQESLAPPETMSFWTLPHFIAVLEQAGFSALRHRLYWQSLLSAPLLLCAMVVIAATFSLRPTRRGGVGAMLALGVATGFVLYFLTDLVYALGLSRRIPIVLAAWAPALVSTLLGASMLLHLEDG